MLTCIIYWRSFRHHIFCKYLFQRDLVGAYHIGTPMDDAELFSSFGSVSAIEGKNGVAGCFSDGSIYLVNRNYKEKESFRISSTGPLTYMKDGVFTALDDNTVVLEPSEAVIIKG